MIEKFLTTQFIDVEVKMHAVPPGTTARRRPDQPVEKMSEDINERPPQKIVLPNDPPPESKPSS